MSLVDSVRDALPESAIKLIRKFRKISITRHNVDEFILGRHLAYILRERSIDLVIDVGANEGQFATMLREQVRFEGPILSFEPQPSSFETLRSRSGQDDRWKVFNLALGASKGVLPFNVMASSVFSSFKKPAAHELLSGLNNVVSEIDVPVERLDEFISKQNIRYSKIFLKVDTQGFDLEVFNGADNIMSAVDAVSSELSFVKIYDEMPSYKEVLDYLEAKGFAVSGLYPTALSQGQAIECDCLMVRRRAIVPGEHIPYREVFVGKSHDGTS